jgi:hypothetical protein
VTLARHAVVGAGAAQRDALIDGDVVADLRGLADHHEAVIDEEIRPILAPGWMSIAVIQRDQ